jgi:hypothetical protein
MIILSVLLVSAVSVSTEGALFFYDDFESGDFVEWDAVYCQYRSNTTIVSITDTPVRRGSYSFKAEDAEPTMHVAALWKYFDFSEGYCRFYVYFPAGFFSSSLTDGQERWIALFNDSMKIIARRYGSGDYRLVNSIIGATFGVQENTWYCVEIELPQCTSNATIRWWVDGAIQTSGTANLSSFGSWQSFLLGVHWASDISVLQVAYFDEVIIADSYIGPLTGTPYNGNFRFDRSPYTVNEGDGNAEITVKRIGGSSGIVSVQYATSNGSAVSGSDYTGVSDTLTWPDGNMDDKTFDVSINNDPDIEGSETINLTLSNPTGGAELGNIVTSPLYIVDNDPVVLMAPTPIISRGKPVYANLDTGNVSRVVDSVYSTSSVERWNPGSVPAWVAVDVGTGYSRLLFVWNSTFNLDYASTYYGPTDYTIQTSADSTNGSDGDWQTVATVTGNIYRTREHSFDFTGKKWVKMNITAVNSGTWGIDEIDIHDASDGCGDTVFFVGDSIFQRALRRTSDRLPGYADNIHAEYLQYYPAMIGGGRGGASTLTWKGMIDDALLANPDMRYWCIGLGSNDITWNCSTSTSFYRKTLQYLIDKIKIAGHIPVVQRIPYNTSALNYCLPIFNQVVDELTVQNGLMTGPDMYAWFSTHLNEFEDSTHPNATGSISINRLWSDVMESLYAASLDTTPPSAPANVRDGTGADISSTISTTQLSANWDASTDSDSGISAYKYAICTTPGGTGTVGWISTNNGTLTSITKTGLSLNRGDIYYFTVKAVNGAGLESNATNSDGQLVEGSSGLPGDDIDVKVWPGPFSFTKDTQITFTVNGTAGGEVKIYTISGKLVKELVIEAGESEVNWDVLNEDGNSITAGLYIYTVTDEQGNKKTGKLVTTE